MLAQSDLVTLRKMRKSDLVPFLEYRSDAETAQFQSWEDMSAVEAEHFLDRMEHLEQIPRPGGWVQIAIADAKTGELRGDMGLYLAESQQEAEIGVTIARPFWRRGFAQSAMLLAIDFMFENNNLQKIICGADERNMASLAMIRKLGFRWTHAETSLSGGPELRDEMFAMMRDEWEQLCTG